MTYEEFQQSLATGRIRLVGDENGNTSYFMYDENGATPIQPPAPPAPAAAPQQSLAERMAAFTPTQWASDRGLGEMEKLINFQQPLPPQFLQQLMQGSSAPSGDPRDMWNDYVRRAQYNPSPTLAETLTSPQNLFFAGTTGLGGMTLANAATGGDVQQGALQDALTLASTAGGQYLAGQGAFAPEVASSGMDFGGQGVGWNPDQITGATEALSPVAETFSVSQPSTLQELLAQAPEAPVPTLADAGITQTYTPSDPLLVNPSTAETPWLSSAPEGSVMAAETATPTINAISNGGGLPSIINAPVAVGASDTVAPTVTGGGEGTATKVAAAGAGGVGATKLGDILSGKVGVTDLAKNLTLGDVGNIAGTGIATVGSVLAQQDIAARNEALAREYMGFGAPSRQRYEASFAPGFDITQDPALKGAMDTSMQSLLRGLSTQGNPFGNPGGMAEALKYVTGNVALPYLQNYRNQAAATGGYGAFSTAAPGAASGAIKAGGDVYADLGRGAAQLFNPPTSLEQALRTIKGLV